MGGYGATNIGLISSAEWSTLGGLTVGGHVVFNHQSLTVNSKDRIGVSSSVRVGGTRQTGARSKPVHSAHWATPSRPGLP